MQDKKLRNIKPLTNTALENISGGQLSKKAKDQMMMCGEIASAVGIFASTACTIATAVCREKGNKAAMNNEISKADKLFSAADKLSIADSILMAVGALGGITYAVGKWG